MPVHAAQMCIAAGVLHNTKEEEKEMFPKAVALLGADELMGLGEQLEARRKTMIAQWKNPIMRPLKKLQSAAEKFAPASLKNAKGKMIVAAKRKSAARKTTSR